MNSAESFSFDYQTARTKFLAAARDAGAALEATLHPERGPDGGDLTTDMAWIGPWEAEAVLVMISATHGVEGFCGSGAQGVNFAAMGVMSGQQDLVVGGGVESMSRVTMGSDGGNIDGNNELLTRHAHQTLAMRRWQI